jgi:S-adenosylmethionine/arginine decarboxylase-like enzyme
MFGRRALLPVDFNSCTAYDPDKALRNFEEASNPDLEEVNATRRKVEEQVKTNIEKA